MFSGFRTDEGLKLSSFYLKPHIVYQVQRGVKFSSLLHDSKRTEESILLVHKLRYQCLDEGLSTVLAHIEGDLCFRNVLHPDGLPLLVSTHESVPTSGISILPRPERVS